MSSIAFTKMHGLGNDFMVIDNIDQSVMLSPERIRQLADRHTGVGFDQLLVVEPPTIANVEFDYRIYNADGAEVEHCGNGARCFARFVSDRKLTASRCIPVNTAAGIIELKLLDDGQVTVNMGVPTFAPASIPFVADKEALHYQLQIAGESIEFGAAAIGNPHLLICVDELASTPVERVGLALQQHAAFPNSVNAGFMQVLDRQHIRLRVFERGVGETRACGTGACAAVAIAHRQGLLDKQVIVTLSGGDLAIDWPNESAPIAMTGPCSTVFEGHTRM